MHMTYLLYEGIEPVDLAAIGVMSMGKRVIPELSYEHLQRLASLIAYETHQIINEERPLLSAWLPTGQRVQVEVRNRKELEQAIEAGAEAILLDNMTPAEVAASVKLIHARGLKLPIEASGGIQLDTIRKYAEAGVDFISSGALTHSASAVDLSMRIVAEN